MIEYRCKFCHKLLFKYRVMLGVPDKFIEVETLCTKCKELNTVLLK